MKGKNIACPSCGKSRDIRYRSRTFDFRCKCCGAIFSRQKEVVMGMMAA